MHSLEEIDAKIKELEQLIASNDDLAHKALDARNFDAAQSFAQAADALRAKLDALRWVCCEVPTL